MSEKKKRVLLIAMISIFALAGIFVAFRFVQNRTVNLYERAVEDARTAEESEILPLVNLTSDSDMVTWNEDETKVLLLSWHEYPDSYKAGASFTCSYGEIWTFTDKEILNWYDENSESVTDCELRLKQLIGLPESAEYTHVSAFWVDIDELIRPAYQTDVTKQVSADLLDGSGLGEHKEWFGGNAEYSYSETTPYPWTRLGYTYDWAKDSDEYGLSEFLILSGSVIEVEWTKSTDEFLTWLESN